MSQTGSGIEREIRNLNAILEVSKAMSSAVQLDTLLQVIVQKTVEVMEADLGSLFLYDAAQHELWSKIAQQLGDVQEIRFPVGVGIAGDVAQSRQGANIADAYADSRFNPEVDKQTGYRTRSLLCLPMLSSTGQLVGVIQVLNKKNGAAFDDRDEALLAALGAHAAVAVERAQLTAAYVEKQRLEEVLQLAREIQMSILPQRFPPFPDRPEIGLYAAIEPAAEVGGDFYDFGLVAEDQLYFTIGDVAGKGVPACLVMAVAKTLLKATASQGYLPDEILRVVNRELCHNNESCTFVTIFCGLLNTKTGEVVYADAGHNPPLVVRRGQSVQFLDKPGGPVAGVLEEARFQTRRVRLQPGDFLFLYTDGVTETMNGQEELFAEARLQQAVGALRNSSPEAVVRGVMQELGRFAQGAPQADDMTLMTVRLQDWGFWPKLSGVQTNRG